jgi:glycosyltransferase involved in cell wall biosynthesis
MNISRHQSSAYRLEGGKHINSHATRIAGPLKPLITIITATYNAVNHLSAAIESIRSQSVDNFEWIVIDGGSTDGTVEMIRRNEDVIDYWVSEPDEGLYDAINKGIHLSAGEYYLLVGSDDILRSDCIERFSKSVLNDDTDVVVAGVDVCGEVKNHGYRPRLGIFGAHFVVTSHSVGMLIRKSVHESVGYYDPSFPQCADGLFIKRLTKQKNLRVVKGDFISGVFSHGGISTTRVLQGLYEGFRVQLATESFRLLQILIFSLRLIKNIRRI